MAPRHARGFIVNLLVLRARACVNMCTIMCVHENICVYVHVSAQMCVCVCVCVCARSLSRERARALSVCLSLVKALMSGSVKRQARHCGR